MPLLFSLSSHPLLEPLSEALGIETGTINQRTFPDGETYLQVQEEVQGQDVLVLADLVDPNPRLLPVLFLCDTLREMGCNRVGLVIPYLPYMRQDKRFHPGEAITSRTFARVLSDHCDWLVTVDPHLHRYHDLSEVYRVPAVAVQGAPVLAGWLAGQQDVFLVGPDSESEQWVKGIAEPSGCPYVIGCKERFGDRQVAVHLPPLGSLSGKTAVIVDDVISSGHTLLECIRALREQGVREIRCATIHGLFAEHSDAALKAAGLDELVSCNTITHPTNRLDVTPVLLPAIRQWLDSGKQEQLS